MSHVQIPDDASESELLELAEEQRALWASEKLRKLVHQRTAQQVDNAEYDWPAVQLSMEPDPQH